MWGCCAHGGLRRVLDLPELKLQVIVSHPYQVLGTQHQSSARAARTPNYSHPVKKNITIKLSIEKQKEIEMQTTGS